MGVNGGGRGPRRSRRTVLSQPEPIRAARVVPAVPTFAVDAGFWYSIPDHMTVGLGTAVRVPLGGRRTGGHVVEIGERSPERLRPIASVSSPIPIFDAPLLEVLMWAAHHYVAPVSVLLEKAAPPNRPRRPDPGLLPARLDGAGAGGLDALGRRSAAGGTGVRLAYVSRAADLGWIAGLAGPVMAAGGGCLIVMPTGAEVSMAETAARPLLGDHLLTVDNDRSDAEVTRAWEMAATVAGVTLVGTPRVASWPVRDLRVAAATEEGRRAMKERQTPTVAVRELLSRRAVATPHNLAFVGPTPSIECLGSGLEEVTAPGRSWGLVELVDRTRDEQSRDLISPTLAAALRRVLANGESAFVFAHRRGYAPAFVCIQCRNVRRCQVCGARPEPGLSCVRCGAVLGPCAHCGSERFRPLGAGVQRVVETLTRVFGAQSVGAAPAATEIQVGSEADLAALPIQDLMGVVDADGLLLGTHFRAAEEAIRILGRVAGKVGRGGTRRAIVQTALPGHPAMVALKSGKALPFLHSELAIRRQLGYPPAGELMIVELRGQVPADPRRALVQLDDGIDLLGPAETRHGIRFLAQGNSLDMLRTGLRPVVQRWRDSGTIVRIDADPLEL